MIKTRHQVLALLSELDSLEWFTSVGLPIAVALPRWLAVSRVGSWDEARLVICSRETEEFLIESQNELYTERDEALMPTRPDNVRLPEFDAWIVGTRPSIRAVADVACQSPIIPPQVGERYKRILPWMIQKACVIRQFDEYVKENRLYCNIIDLLRSGHCVCGWEGEYPAGSLVVY